MDTLTTLFLSKRRYLASIAYNVLHDSEEAKDIIQDAFLKLWQKREQLRFTPELNTLMCRTVYRLALDSLSRREYRERFVKMAEKGIADVIPERHVPDIIPQALSLVQGDRCREIMSKRYQEGKTCVQTAKEMGISVQAVRNACHESVKMLRKKLKGSYVG